MFNHIAGPNGCKLDRVTRATGAHIDTEHQSDRAVLLIKGTTDQIQSAYNLVMSLANRPSSRDRSKKKRGRNGAVVGPKTRSTCSRPPLDSCEVRTADTSKTSAHSVVTVTSARNTTSSRSTDVVSSKANCVVEGGQFSSDAGVRAGPFAPSMPVKEYSLFDNVFSRTVEQALGRKDSPPPALPSRSPAHQPTSLFACTTKLHPNVIVDQALLAKAPGYRSSASVAHGNPFAYMPEIPFPAAAAAAGFQWERRARKYSDSSSSGRSSEDSGVGSIVGGGGGFTVPPGFASGPTRFDQQLSDTGSRSPPIGGHCWSLAEPLDDVSKPVDLCSAVNYHVSSAAVVGVFSSREEQYSIPDKPMTLPRIASDLNPNAPDFVYDPQHLSVASQLQQPTNGPFILPDQPSFGGSFDGLSIAGPAATANSRAVGSERRKTSSRQTWNKLDVEDFPPLPLASNASQLELGHAMHGNGVRF